MQNFKAINDHVEATFVDIQDIKPLSTASAQSELCRIYKVVRPIIVDVSKWKIIPKSWKTALSTFVSILDVICP